MSDTDSDPPANMPIPLAKAAELFFPYGGVKVSTLRTAIKDGRLAFIKIDQRYFVTREAINRMIELCTVASSPEPIPVIAKARTDRPRGPNEAVEAASLIAKELRESGKASRKARGSR
jgi:hypothetical protein